MNCGALVSHQPKDNFVVDIISEYLNNKVFNVDNDNGVVLNSGLMIGYVKYLRLIFKDITSGPSKDDQRNLNNVYKNYSFLKVDTDNIIFENCNSEYSLLRSNAFICQRPGTLSVQRICRAIPEYSFYFIEEILIFIMLIIIFYRNQKSKPKIVN